MNEEQDTPLLTPGNVGDAVLAIVGTLVAIWVIASAAHLLAVVWPIVRSYL